MTGSVRSALSPDTTRCGRLLACPRSSRRAAWWRCTRASIAAQARRRWPTWTTCSCRRTPCCPRPAGWSILSSPVTGRVGRLTGGEVDSLLGGQLLAWTWSGRDWQVASFPAVDFEHPPLVLIAGRPAGQSIYAAVTVTAWEAQLVELLKRSRQQE